MNKQKSIEEFQKMYDELTDPEKREEARRKHEIKKLQESKKSDTGIC